MIAESLCELLRNQKNLLAFSAGVDSTALFFLLLEKNIPFDIAIVNYNKRTEAQTECDYAINLAEEHKKQIWLKSVELEDVNFEKHAREVRYSFFEKLISEHQYDNLLTAHQLNDRLEWFLMQFTKGSGIVESLGMEMIERRSNYALVRPLLESSREEILRYLKENNLTYFEDATNEDQKYRRNFFRHNFSDALISKFSAGIKRSFRFLEKDAAQLKPTCEIHNQKEFYLFREDSQAMRSIDYILKREGILLSTKNREEILNTKDCVISHKIAVVFSEGFVYIAPFIKQPLEKKQKELLRIEKIPQKIRPYIIGNGIDIEAIINFRETYKNSVRIDE